MGEVNRLPGGRQVGEVQRRVAAEAWLHSSCARGRLTSAFWAAEVMEEITGGLWERNLKSMHPGMEEPGGGVGEAGAAPASSARPRPRTPGQRPEPLC